MRMTRRNFIEKSSLAVAGFGVPTLVPASVFGKHAPSNRIHVGFIGTGRQVFSLNLPQMLALPEVQVVAVCDVDSWRMSEAQKVVNGFYASQKDKASYKGCRAVADFREIMADKNMDALMISTPDHWHVPMGLMAAKAKKHFSIEKPISLSVEQGRMLSDAVKKYKVITRTDSEFRSVRVQNQAVELVRNGHIGKLEKIEISFPSDPAPVAAQPDMPVPKELNYEMWLGPSPFAPYTGKRVHDPFQTNKRPNWMRVSTYAQGMISNWGAHYFDLAQWANNSEYTGPAEVEGKGEFPLSLWNTMINFEITYRYANGVEMSCRQTPTSTPFIKYTGNKGWILVDNYPGVLTSNIPGLASRQPESGELNLSGTLDEKKDFIEGIKAGKQTLEPVEVGHRTISIAQIGLIAAQVGDKLKWDPEKERFEGNNYANSLLCAPLARKPWN
jgi:myo-inositol 2-dehydrogenase / D-chiro-inositol 1-dehydrogenase